MTLSTRQARAANDGLIYLVATVGAVVMILVVCAGFGSTVMCALVAYAFARSRYPVDIHSPTGEGTIIQHLPPGELYEVPYRCLVPKNVDNLLIGARCISSTHEAHSSLRVMPVSAIIGEAAGIAAAWAAQQGITPRQVDGVKLKVAVFG